MIRIPFEFNNTPYNDPVYGVTLLLSGSGCAFAEDSAAGAVTESGLSAAVASSISDLNAEFSYDRIPRNTERLLPMICSRLSGAALSSVEFSACYPDDAGLSVIVRVRSAEMPANAKITGDKLVLLSAGSGKIEVIKYLTNNFGLGLAAAKAFTENTPAVICEGLSAEQLEAHINALADLGAEAGSQ